MYFFQYACRLEIKPMTQCATNWATYPNGKAGCLIQSAIDVNFIYTVRLLLDLRRMAKLSTTDALTTVASWWRQSVWPDEALFRRQRHLIEMRNEYDRLFFTFWKKAYIIDVTLTLICNSKQI